MLDKLYPEMRKPSYNSKRFIEEPCPVCVKGERRDAKTLEIRKCVACRGTGWIKVTRR